MSIFALAVKLTDGSPLEILKAGEPTEVADAIALEIHRTGGKTRYIGLEPTFAAETLAGQRLQVLAENPVELGAVVAGIEFEDGSQIVVRPGDSLNPHRKDPTGIPVGNYCYHGTREPREGEPTQTPDGRSIHYLNLCPYMDSRTFNGVTIPWCNYLDKGGLEGTLKPGQTREEAKAEFEKLVEHFGGEEEVYRVAPLDLLFDSCKECGVNVGRDDT